MKILVVAATYDEIQPLCVHFGFPVADHTINKFDFVVTGVGIAATSFTLGSKLSPSYSLILNLGIAGSFNKAIGIGEVVNVVEDRFSELGARDGDDFISLDELGFGKTVFQGKKIPSLKNVKGITVNTVHGDARTIEQTVRRLDPDIESMEGAAAFYCAEASGIQCLQIRAISNFVEPRNKDNWDVQTAIQNLNKWAINFLEEQFQ